MRYRIGGVGMTGLGNPYPEQLDNQGVLQPIHQEMLHEGLSLFFPKHAGVDYCMSEGKFLFGFEPSYMYEHEKIICIARDKGRSYMTRGVAWGGWGSNVARTTRYYGNYAKRSKFIKFVDRWHERLFMES